MTPRTSSLSITESDRNTVINSIPDFRRAFFLIPALMFLLTSCSADGSPEENGDRENDPTAEAEEESPTRLWVKNESAREIILRMTAERSGELTATGSENEPFLADYSSIEYSASYETDLDLLVDLGMLAEAGDGYEIASHNEITDLPRSEEIVTSARTMALDSALNANDVDWCGKPERGRDVRDDYLDTFADEDNPAYTTKAEYLESIEDYVDCGDGHI